VNPLFKQFRKPQFIATYHFLIVAFLLLLAQYFYNKSKTFIEKKILKNPAIHGIPLIHPEIHLPFLPYKIKKTQLTSIDTLILEFNPINNSNFQGKAFQETLNISLNSCDSVQLTCVKGIGPATAMRILRYRERLGGFVSKFQLLEINYFDSGIINNENTNWIVDNSKVIKIPISESNIRELYRHPYIGKDLTKRLLSYKKFHKKLTLIDLDKMQTLSPSLRKILSLYLEFDDLPK